MQISAYDIRIQLRKSSNLKLRDARGARLSAVGGTAWITVERDARDIVMLPGDAFIVPSDRLVLVDPLSGAATLDLQGVPDAGSGALTHGRGLVEKIRSFVGWERPLRDELA